MRCPCVTKKFKAFRFDPELYEKFKEVTQNSNLMVTEAFEKFMRACVEIGAVKFPDPQLASVKLKLKPVCYWHGDAKVDFCTN